MQGATPWGRGADRAGRRRPEEGDERADAGENPGRPAAIGFKYIAVDLRRICSGQPESGVGNQIADVKDSKNMGETVARWIVVVLLAGLCLGPSAGAESFTGTPTGSKTYYVDEIWKIPEEYRGQVGRYLRKTRRSPFGPEGPGDGSRAESPPGTGDGAAAPDRGPAPGNAPKPGSRTVAAEAEADQQQQLKAMETKVTIANNQILVPVAFTNSGQRQPLT
jgi:hypothetical protein